MRLGKEMLVFYGVTDSGLDDPWLQLIEKVDRGR